MDYSKRDLIGCDLLQGRVAIATKSKEAVGQLFQFLAFVLFVWRRQWKTFCSTKKYFCSVDFYMNQTLHVQFAKREPHTFKMKDVEGIMRSWCKKCGKNECREFRPKKSGLKCGYCGHVAVKHVKLDVTVEMEAGVMVRIDFACSL